MKRGFTLIELLAVIVILAIIALIATPIILGIIKDAKDSAVERSAELYLSSINLALAREQLANNPIVDGEYIITSDGNIALKSDPTKIYRVDVKNNVPSSGELTIQDGKIVNSTVQLVIDDKYVVYDDTNNKLQISNGGIEIEKYTISTLANQLIDVTQDAVFTSNADISDFSGVKIDGSLISSDNYTVTEGSTIVTLKSAYLRTLSEGSHTIKIVSTDGIAKTTFRVVPVRTVVVYSTIVVRSIAGVGRVSFDQGLNVSETYGSWDDDVSASYIRYELTVPNGSTLHLTAQPREWQGNVFYGWTRTKPVYSGTSQSWTATYSSELGLDLEIDVEITEDTTIYALWEAKGCFKAGTQITMSDWTTRNIEDIKIGDRVISYNVHTKEYYTTTVRKTGRETVISGYYEIELENGMKVSPTANHPILTIDGFKAIDESIYFEALSLNDKIVTTEGIFGIRSINHIDYDYVDVYWIDVKDDDEEDDEDDDTDDTHIADGVIVHNGIYDMISANKNIDFESLGLFGPPEPFCYEC